MKKTAFPWIALGLGLLLAAIMVKAGAMDPDRTYLLPLLTLLLMNEFGFIVTLIGAGMGVHAIVKQGVQTPLILAALGCVLLAGGFLWMGILLWPGAEGLG